MENIKKIIYIGIKANSAEQGPPLGTVLGNIGVNAIKFAKDFNEYTIDLPIFYKLNVTIYILRNNNYSFTAAIPSTGWLLSLLKKTDVNGGYFFYFSDLIKLAKLKFPKLPLKTSIKIILGSVKSCNNSQIYFYK